MCARMQTAHSLGAGAAVRAGSGWSLFAEAGATLVWAKSAAERHIEKKARPPRERFFIATFFAVLPSGLVSPTQCNSRLADRYVSWLTSPRTPSDGPLGNRVVFQTLVHTEVHWVRSGQNLLCYNSA